MRNVAFVLTVVLFILGSFLLGYILGHKRITAANNRYSLYVYPTKVILEAGETIVGEVPFPTNSKLDSLILADNQ